MAYKDWMIRTTQINTCSRDYGCPCEFNAPPARLPCEGVMASATFWSEGALDQKHAARIAALSFVSYGPHGIIPDESFPDRSAWRGATRPNA